MTRTRPASFAALLGLVLVVAACGAAGAEPQGTAPVDGVAGTPVATGSSATMAPPTAGPTDGMAPGPSATGGSETGAGPTSPPATAVTGWRGVALKDARSGATFTLADYAGSLVAIEPMAAWCPKCLAQQREARKALEQLGDDRVVYVSLGVDPSEKAKDLAAYADDHGFGWTFAVAPKELSRALAAEFGDQVLSPPSVPFILVGADGTVIEQHFGGRSADELATLLAQHLP